MMGFGYKKKYTDSQRALTGITTLAKQFELKLSDSCKKLAQVTSKSNEAQEIIKGLEGETKHLETENKALIEQVEEQANAKKEKSKALDDLRSKHKTALIKLQSSLRMVESNEQAIKDLQSKVSELELELRGAKGREESAKKRLEESESQYKERERQLRSQLAAALSQGRESLFEQAKVQDQFYELEKVKHQLSMKEFDIARNAKRINELETLNRKVADSKYDSDREIRTLRAEKREAGEQLKRLRTDLAELAEEKRELETENRGISAEKDALERQLETEQEKSRENEDNMRAARKMSDTVEALTKRHGALKAERDKMADEYEDWRSQVATRCKELVEAAKEMEEARALYKQTAAPGKK